MIGWSQARELGVPRTQLSGGELVLVRRGAYAERRALAGLDEPGRTAVAVAAARLVSQVDLVACRLTATALHELPRLGPLPAAPQLLERREERPRHHGQSTTVPPGDVTVRIGVPVTSLPRTVVDVARRYGWLAGVLVADAVLARGIPAAALQEVADRCRSWPGAGRARRALLFADGRSESPLESLGRVRFSEQRLPACEPQAWLGDEHGPIGRVDHYWEAHRTIAEADGARKYADSVALFAEKEREDRLREAGFEVVRYTWDEAWRRPEMLAARVRRAFGRAAERQRRAG